MKRFFIACGLLMLSIPFAPVSELAAAQQGIHPVRHPGEQDPLIGCWNATDTQGGTGTAKVTITQGAGNTLNYSSSSGDTGMIAPVTGGYAFSSSNGGGAGVIQSNGNGTYAWQNTQTGSGGTMTSTSC